MRQSKKEMKQCPKRRKKKSTPGKQFTGSNLNKFLNTSFVHNDDEKCQLPTNTQLRSPVISVHYGNNQTTAQRFNSEAACNFPDYKQPLLSCVLNGTVTFKTVLSMTTTCRVYVGTKHKMRTITSQTLPLKATFN